MEIPVVERPNLGREETMTETAKPVKNQKKLGAKKLEKKAPLVARRALVIRGIN